MLVPPLGRLTRAAITRSTGASAEEPALGPQATSLNALRV